RRPAAADHSEVDLGAIAGPSDIGSRHHHNEDAMGLAVAGATTVAVVCDGVSSSSLADTASTAAVAASLEAFVKAVATHTADAAELLVRMGAAAQAAAALAGVRDTGPNPPSSTFVAAVVQPEAVTVGWVGDSRAYWLPDAGTPDSPACLTVDDTL